MDLLEITREKQASSVQGDHPSIISDEDSRTISQDSSKEAEEENDKKHMEVSCSDNPDKERDNKEIIVSSNMQSHLHRNQNNSYSGMYKKHRSSVPLPYSMWPKGVALPNSFTALDMETTGLDHEKDQIIEIAGVRVRDGKVVDEFECLVQCGILLSDIIQDLTGLNDEIIKREGIPLSEAVHGIIKFFGDDCLVGHNIAFDVRFLQKACKNLNVDLPDIKAIDTVGVAHEAISNPVANYRQETLIKYFGIATKQSHRALPDAHLAAQLYLKLNEILRTAK